MINRPSLLFLCAVLAATPAYAAHQHREKEFQVAWCEKENGELEHVFDDGARADCLTDEYAVEFDFAPKWAESIGQSLYYALKSGKKPGVVLIIEKPSDEHYLKRLKAVADKYGISVWEMRLKDAEDGDGENRGDAK